MKPNQSTEARKNREARQVLQVAIQTATKEGDHRVAAIAAHTLKKMEAQKK